MGPDPFDPEDFLNLKDVTPETDERDLTPIVEPPVYQRRRAVPAEPRPPVTIEASVYRPAARPADTAPPLTRHPEAPRQPQGRLQGQPPIRHNIPGQGGAPAAQPPVAHHIPGFGPQPAAPSGPSQNPAPAAPQPAALAPIRHNIPGQDGPRAAAPAAPRPPVDQPAPDQAPAPVPQFRHAPRQPAPQPPIQYRDPAPLVDAPQDDPFADFQLAEQGGLPQPYVAAPPPAPAPPRTPVQDHAGQQGGAVVREPLSIAFRGAEYPTQTWSVNGFILKSPLPLDGTAQGRVIDLTLLIGRGVTRIEMRVQARAENDGAELPTRFVFVDLDRAQAEVLHRIVDHVVSNQALTLTQLLNETEDSRRSQRATGERMRRFRTGFQLSLAAVVLVAAAGVTWNSFTSVESRYGAVTVGATSLSVPIAGIVSAITMTPGQTVAQGEVLGYVRPADFDRRQFTMDSRRQQVLDERAELLARYDTMRQLAAISVEGADTDRSRIEQQLTLAERRLEVEQSQLAALRAGGLPTAERQRERAAQEARVLQAETAVLEVRARLDALRQVAVLAPLGVAGGDLGANTQTLDAVERRIAALTDELDRMDALGIDTDLGEPILSPCDCTVQVVERRNGEWADPDQQLAVLVGAEAPTVHALVLSEQARQISIGDTARIRLADGTTLDGSVQRMNYDPHWRGFAGLQDNVFAADRYARIEVRPAAPLTAPVGMVADVTVRTNGLWGWLRGMVGL